VNGKYENKKTTVVKKNSKGPTLRGGGVEGTLTMREEKV